MIQVDLQCAFLMGSAMAGLARRELPHASRAWWERAIGWVYIVGGVAFTPTWLYITLRWTAWETQYAWDLSTLPRLMAALFVVAITLSCKAGFLATAALVKAGRLVSASLVNGAVAASIVAILALRWDRVRYVGPLAGYHPGVPGNFLHSDLLVFLVVVTILVLVPFGLLVVHKIRQPIR